jgi:hypothetical protein
MQGLSGRSPGAPEERPRALPEGRLSAGALAHAFSPPVDTNFLTERRRRAAGASGGKANQTRQASARCGSPLPFFQDSCLPGPLPPTHTHTHTPRKEEEKTKQLSPSADAPAAAQLPPCSSAAPRPHLPRCPPPPPTRGWGGAAGEKRSRGGRGEVGGQAGQWGVVRAALAALEEHGAPRGRARRSPQNLGGLLAGISPPTRPPLNKQARGEAQASPPPPPRAQSPPGSTCGGCGAPGGKACAATKLSCRGAPRSRHGSASHMAS